MFQLLKSYIFRKTRRVWHIFFHYDDLKNFNTHENIAEKIVWQKVNRYLKNKKNLCIMELGCVNGRNLILSNKILKSKYIGIDLNARAISNGKNYLKKNKIINIKLIRKDISKINSFDCNYIVMCSFLIYLKKNELLNFLKKVQKSKIKEIFIMDKFSKKDFFCSDHYYHNKQIFKILKKNYKIYKKKINYKIWDKNKTQSYFIKLTRKNNFISQ